MSSELGGGDQRGLSGDLAWAPPLPAHRKASCRMKNAPQSLPEVASATVRPKKPDSPAALIIPALVTAQHPRGPAVPAAASPSPRGPPGAGPVPSPQMGPAGTIPPALCPQGSRGAAGCCHCSVFARAAWCRALYPRFQSLFGANYIPLPPFPFSILPVPCVWEIMQPGGPKSAATPPTLAWSHGEADPPWPCPGG